MIMSDVVAELFTALAKAQGEFITIPKGDYNPFFKSNYAGLPAVVQAATPVLNANGLAVTQTMGYDGDYDTLTTMLTHESGQWVRDTTRMHLGKSDAQGHGSATTYARRYSYMAILGLVADQDDDGNAAQAPKQTAKDSARASLYAAIKTAGKDAAQVAKEWEEVHGRALKNATVAEMATLTKELDAG